MLDVEKSWIENQEYLRNLCDILKSKKDTSTIDSNLVYEVAYAKTYISILKSKESLINSSFLSDCESVFDLVLSKVPYQDLPFVPTEEYKNLLKCKFTKVEEAGVPSYVEKPGDPAPVIYIRRKFLSMSLFVVFGGFLLSGGASGFSKLLVGLFQSKSESVESIVGSFSIFLTGAIVLMLCVSIVQVAVSILYTSVPFLRTEEFSKLMGSIVSPEAKEAVRDSIENLVVKEKIHDFDRIKRNEVWLQSLIEAEKASKGYFFVDGSVLAGLDERIKTSQGEDYYLALAQIEFLHNEFLNFCSKVD